jgi:hypothetical protein
MNGSHKETSERKMYDKETMGSNYRCVSPLRRLVHLVLRHYDLHSRAWKLNARTPLARPHFNLGQEIANPAHLHYDQDRHNADRGHRQRKNQLL